MYEKYLTEIVVPKIVENRKVVIQGHTDVIGETENKIMFNPCKRCKGNS